MSTLQPYYNSKLGFHNINYSNQIILIRNSYTRYFFIDLIGPCIMTSLSKIFTLSGCPSSPFLAPTISTLIAFYLRLCILLYQNLNFFRRSKCCSSIQKSLFGPLTLVNCIICRPKVTKLYCRYRSTMTYKSS